MSDKVLKVSVISGYDNIKNFEKLLSYKEFQNKIKTIRDNGFLRHANVFIPLNSILYFSESYWKNFEDGKFFYFYIALRDRINLSNSNFTSSEEKVFIVEGEPEKIVPILLNENIEK